ncbi:YeeE/YedE family protein [Roseivivax marinus]|jgi:hypothetical protein|uniref:Seryl-tRNA synthetase n=1 Tax=Profundibacterium mesophilum KAUST100406-0324 TaxID=1037889 RepID=A0A921NPN8_9RHOB|nr:MULTISPECIES: DUF6691 family protein [Roseobacteraceae]KAF0675622.1 seryl-tRNA synthetase [Profundibacterium mesophilum KAUST100406-0324]UMA64028.1 YeeE/YedE family protein [Roseivivax marinus]
MRNFLGFAAGLVFGIGLIISGMTDPAKVLNFLDILGPWDPSLAFVMGGASVTAFIGYRLIWRRERPVMGSQFDLPDSTAIDAPLLTGAAIFGMGWGLGGFCPGPAWTSLLIGSSGILIFLPAMLVGIVLAGFAKSSSSFASKGA